MAAVPSDPPAAVCGPAAAVPPSELPGFAPASDGAAETEPVSAPRVPFAVEVPDARFVEWSGMITMVTSTPSKKPTARINIGLERRNNDAGCRRSGATMNDSFALDAERAQRARARDRARVGAEVRGD